MTDGLCLYCKGPLPWPAFAGYCCDDCQWEDTRVLSAELDASRPPPVESSDDPPSRNDHLYGVQPPMKRPEKESADE